MSVGPFHPWPAVCMNRSIRTISWGLYGRFKKCNRCSRNPVTNLLRFLFLGDGEIAPTP